MESFLATQHVDWSVHGIPAFNDNYLWAVVHNPSGKAFVVDPGCAASVQAFLTATGYHLSGILVTHHHPDHTGGVQALVKASGSTGLPVHGPDNPRIVGINQIALADQTFEAVGLSIKTLAVPGHTLDHLAFVVDFRTPETPTAPCWLFCGDTLFSGGCGRLFEGSAEQMFNSLQLLNQLPAHTLVFCAHEYTLSNLTFAIHECPDDPDVLARYGNVKEMRGRGISTIPTCLKTERLSNVFLRAASAAEFARLRAAKDRF